MQVKYIWLITIIREHIFSCIQNCTMASLKTSAVRISVEFICKAVFALYTCQCIISLAPLSIREIAQNSQQPIVQQLLWLLA